MATIDSLTKSFLDLTADEKHKFVLELRNSRRTPPERPKKNSKTRNSSSKKKPKASPSTLLKAMSPEDAAALIEMLEKELL